MNHWKSLFLRSMREGSVQVWRNKFLSGTTILLGALIVFLLNFIFSIQFFADYSLKNLESRADFSLEMRSNFSAFDLEALENELGMYDTVVEVLPAENTVDFQIPTRLHVQFHNLEEVGDILTILKKTRYDSVIGTWDGEAEKEFVGIIDQLLRIRDGVKTASLWLIAFFLGGGILLMINTFRIVLFSRRDEVFISRLVGASPRFISGPFLMEGLLLGMASSVLGIGAFIFILREIDVLPGGEIFLYLWNQVFSWEIFAAGGVGVLGAWISVRKYLTGKFNQ